eukprot:3039303-Rhodomonas_salina.1
MTDPTMRFKRTKAPMMMCAAQYSAIQGFVLGIGVIPVPTASVHAACQLCSDVRGSVWSRSPTEDGLQDGFNGNGARTLRDARPGSDV